MHRNNLSSDLSSSVTPTGTTLGTSAGILVQQTMVLSPSRWRVRMWARTTTEEYSVWRPDHPTNSQKGEGEELLGEI